MPAEVGTSREADRSVEASPLRESRSHGNPSLSAKQTESRAIGAAFGVSPVNRIN